MKHLPALALSLLAAIGIVSGLAAAAPPEMPPYNRAAFGNGWAPVRPGCDVRDIVLARDLEPETWRGCNVVAGTLRDPYTGQTVTGPSRAFDIDHVVPLALAWRLGAWRWTAGRRVAFANDLGELRATTVHENRSKGDAGLDEWLPAVDPCGYARQFDTIADRYRLDDPARDGQVAHACGGP